MIGVSANEGDKIRIKVMKVPKTHKYPHGFKYRLTLIHEGERVLEYDNAYPEGDHKHERVGNRPISKPYDFKTPETVIEHFMNDFKAWKRTHYGNRNN